MQPESQASTENASANAVTATLFDDVADWNTLSAVPSPWSKSGSGTPVVSGGALSVDNATVNRTLPTYASGVFECDVMVDDATEQTTITLVDDPDGDQIQWVFENDGTWKAKDGANLVSTGGTYMAHQWYHLRIEWDGEDWWARMDGVRYPSTGTYAMGLSGEEVTDVELANGSSSGSASFDNIRTYPQAAQPTPMTTFDPITLAISALTDENGLSARYVRDGLGRLIQTRDSAGRVTGQRDFYFSRITDTDPFDPEDPNRQTLIAYPSAHGHKDLSKSGDRTISPGNTLEEGVTLTTADPYVISNGQSVIMRASTRITLTTGFHAQAGTDFHASIDPQAGADQVSGQSQITYNQFLDGERAVKLGASSTLEAGNVTGHVTARADFNPGAVTTNKTTILAFDDGIDYVKVVFDNGAINLERDINGQYASSSMSPGYLFSWPWARVEMELLPNGACHAWLYGYKDMRFKYTTHTVTGLDQNWSPNVKAEGVSGDGYLANLYVGPAEVVTASFDGLSRPIQTKVRTGESDIVTQTVYNRVDQPDSVRGPVAMTPGYAYGVLDITTAGNKFTRTTYMPDPLLRPNMSIPPGHTAANAVYARYGYWGAESGVGRTYETVVDEEGVAATSVYDSYGRLHYTFADSGGTDANTKNNKTGFAYDAMDRLIRSTAPEGDQTHYTYDNLGRLIRKWQPDADDSTAYKYDDLGRLRFSQDAQQEDDGKVTFTVYDALSRITRIGEATATFSTLDPNASYSFETDAASWRTKLYYDEDYTGDGINYGQGRVTKAEENTDADSGVEITHLLAYNHIGGVRLKQVSIDGLTASKTVEYAYDLSGRVTRLVYPDGKDVRYTYETGGRLTQVADAEGNPFAAYTYTDAGNIDTHTVGNNIVTGNYAYTPRDWVTDIDYLNKFQSTLTYDDVGNVTQQVYQHGTGASVTAAYGYDPLHRLKTFDLSTGEDQDFTYDRNGNILTKVTDSSTLTYNYSSSTTPNRLDSTSGTGGMSYGYNANGAMTTRGAQTYGYDHRGMAVSFSDASQSYTYLVDSDGRRVKKSSSGETLYYIIGADGAVLETYDGSQALETTYVYAGSNRIAKIEGGTTGYYLTDHLGNTRALVDESGAVGATYDYWPYGEVLALGGTDATRYKFTGHERDGESGQDNMINRLGDPFTGRMNRIDPKAGDYPWLSPYAYANNNPVKFVDPDGNAFQLPAQAVGAIVGGVLDAAIQVGVGMAQGQSLVQAASNIDVGSVTVSAVAGAVGVGLASKFKQVGALGQLAIQGAENTVEAAGGIALQAASGEQVDVQAAAVGLAAGVVVGSAGGKVGKGGITTANGIEIKGFTSHAVDRAIGNEGEKRIGIAPKAILGALKNPLKIGPVKLDQHGRPSQRFVGAKGTVAVNPENGRIVSVNPTSAKRARKLLKESEPEE